MTNETQSGQESEADKAARKAEAQALSAHETPTEQIRRRLAGSIYLIAGVILVLVIWSLIAVFQSVPGGPANSQQSATATATSCDQVGPVGRFGFGYWWTCHADVRWPNQNTPVQDVPFYTSELTPADIGKPTQVTPESTDNRGGGSLWYTDTTRPLWFMGIISYFAIVVTILYFAAHGLARLLPLSTRLELDKNVRARYRDFYQREGRIPPTSQARQASEQYPPPPPYQPGPGQQPPTGFGNGSDRSS